MNYKVFNSIGGVSVIVEVVTNGPRVMEFNLPDHILNAVAMACMDRLGEARINDQLVEMCREVVSIKLVLTSKQIKFIKDCEDQHEACRQDQETLRQYYDRLFANYSS